MRILLSASTVPASPEDAVPRFVLDQALAMAAADPDLHVDILAPHTPASHGRRWPQQESLDGRVIQYRFRYASRRWETLTQRGIMPALAESPLRVLLLPALLACQSLALWRLARRQHPDLIYAHWFTPQALTARVVSRLRRVPFGFTTHASDVVVWKRFGLCGRRVVRSTVAKAAFCTAVSSQTAAKLLGFFDGQHRDALEHRLAIIPMGVDYEDGPTKPGDPLHVLIIARLVEKKGLKVLLDAWPSVIAQVPQAALTIAGDGPLRDELERQVRANNLEVSMPGFVTGAAKQALLDSAGVIVQPSVIAKDGDSDGLPVAALEGLAAGRVVVASDASGAQDVIENQVSGFLVPAGDADALAEALVAALTLKDADREDMSRRARQVARTMAWPAIAARHLKSMFP